MLDKIYLSRYKFTLLPEHELHLPQYLGSTLRGGFGSVFRKIVCCYRDRICNECLLKSKCIYSYIFETSPPEGSEKLRNIESIPRPYIIDPPAFDSTAVYSPERPLRFYLNLIGKAVEYFPYFIVAFQELGKVGIGRKKEKFIIQEVEIQDIATGNLEQIYFPNGTVLNKRYIFSLEDALKQINTKDYTAIKIDFLSPVRLKAGSYQHIPVFRHFFGSLLRRLSSLSYFHCDTELKISYANILTQAEHIELFDNHTHWKDWERYSSRQQTKMKFGGLMGSTGYEGNLTPFMPYLNFGQWIHVGKNATFGLGKYEILSL